MDADCVALAAIHGLNQKLEQTVREKDAEIQALKKGRLKASDRRRRLGEQGVLRGEIFFRQQHLAALIGWSVHETLA